MTLTPKREGGPWDMIWLPAVDPPRMSMSLGIATAEQSGRTFVGAAMVVEGRLGE